MVFYRYWLSQSLHYSIRVLALFGLAVFGFLVVTLVIPSVSVGLSSSAIRPIVNCRCSVMFSSASAKKCR